MRRMRMMMMEEEGGTGGPTTTTPGEDGVGDDGGDGGEPDPAAGGGGLRHDPERAEIQGEGMSSGDEGMSSDGERGGDEYANEFCEMPADFDEWGGPSYDLGASGGGGYY